MLQETTQYTSPLQGKISFQIRKGISCDYHRIDLPARAIGINTEIAPTHALLNVVCRFPDDDSRVINGKSIVDVDDYWHLYPHHYLHGIWHSSKSAQRIVSAIERADMVTVTNLHLWQKVRQFNSRVEILPNALPFDEGQFKLLTGDAIYDKAKFFWAGGASHAQDLAVIRNVLTSTQFDLTLMGDDGGGQWAKIRTSFGGRAKFIKMLSVESYMTGYEGNVMLVPLENNYFNIHKSNLKVLEAGCKGMAVIASRMHPYYNAKDMPYVMYADNLGEWQSHIRYCIANPGFVKDMGLALADHVRREYDLHEVNIKRRHIYESLAF